jgi:hypothetical protein
MAALRRVCRSAAACCSRVRGGCCCAEPRRWSPKEYVPPEAARYMRTLAPKGLPPKNLRGAQAHQRARQWRGKAVLRKGVGLGA